MAFLAQQGLPDHLIVSILAQAGCESLSNVCATSRENAKHVHSIQCDFPASWHRVYATEAGDPPQRGALAGVKGMRVVVGSVVPSTVRFPPTLRSLVVVWGDCEEDEFLEHLDLKCPELRSLRLESHSEQWNGIDELRSRVIPENIEVLRVVGFKSLWLIKTLPAHLRELEVCPSVCTYQSHLGVPEVAHPSMNT